jgi:glycosyltransferase involved in cell wall biosynthesis
MACGVPVIARDLPSLREWITSGENGLLLTQCNPESISEAIQTLLLSSDIRDKYINRNLELIKERADHNNEMRKMEALYREIVSRTK